MHPARAMRRRSSLFPTAALVLAAALLFAAPCGADTGAAQALPRVDPVPTILINTDDEVVVRFDIAGPGWPRSLHLQVPDLGRIEASVEPPGAARVSPPGLMRDLRLVQVAFEPTSRPVDITVRLTASPGPGRNERIGRARPLSPELEALYRSTVPNYRSRGERDIMIERGVGLGDLGGRDEIEFGARYLVITTPSFASIVQDLADWRHLMGLQAMVVDLNTTGSDPASIKSYIQNAYDVWSVPPEYVLLVGDTEQIPAIEDGTATDDYYAQLEGDDLFIDVLIGRLSADSPGECATLVAKTLGYERTPPTSDPDWPQSGMLMVADDYDDGDWIYYMNTWFVYDLMEDAGFTEIDTLFAKNGVSSGEVYDSWNAGRGFVNFRGQAWTNWPGAFGINPDYLTNGWRLPIVVSATCATGIYHGDNYICEDVVRAGTATDPRGAVAFIGSNTAYPGSGRLARMRGAGDMAFFEQAFGEYGGDLGAAALATKLAVYEFDGDTVEYKAWNLLGDPAMRVWTADPAPMSVLHDEYFHASQSGFTVTALSGGQALEGALVACTKAGDIYAWGYTDATGQVSFALTPSSSGTLTVTVTARNHIPYEGSATVLDSGSFIVFESMTIDDASGGDGDGLLSPGETASLIVSLENTGDVGAGAVSAVLRTLDAEAVVIDSVAAYGNILPSETVIGTPAYRIEALAGCPVGERIPLELLVTNGDTTRSLAPPTITIATGDLDVVDLVVDDPAPGGDGGDDASPGETVGLVLTFENVGPCDVTGVTATLSSADAGVTVTSSIASLGDLPSGATAATATTPFVISIAPDAPDGHDIELTVDLSGEGHSYTYEETVTIDLPVSGPTMSLASGPDGYGYYCYDISDSIYACAPDYEWLDISSPGPGYLIEEITDEDAATVTVNLPFNFVYYGTSYLRVSVCSNGFVSVGEEDYRFGNNSGIPHTDGPENMIAPFWDDLDPSVSGDVYKWYDADNHRFIIQFDEVPIWNTMDTQTFQVILLDQDDHATPSGDGAILIVYETVTSPSGCTVGIENADETDGIQYLFDGAYDAHAAPLTGGSALLFTTEEPVEPEFPWLVLDSMTVDDADDGDGDGRAEPGETVRLSMEILNKGATNAMDVSAVLSSASPAAAVIDAATTYPNILVGGTALNDADLTIEITESPGDTVATLWLELTSNSGGYEAAVRCELHIDLSATGVADIPLAFGMRPCYPNPFSGGTSMQLALPRATEATVAVYTPAGRLVRTLCSAALDAGTHQIDWDGRDRTGHRVASGVYFVRAVADGREQSRKVVLLR